MNSSERVVHGAPGGIRTPNSWSEASRDIHFTTRAEAYRKLEGSQI